MSEIISAGRPSLLILGAGGFGRVVREAAEDMDMFGTIAFLDDQAKTELVVGTLQDHAALSKHYDCAVVAMGNNPLRLEWLDKLEKAGYALPVIVHPTAWISRSADIQPGTIVLHNAVVNTNAVVERGCIINCGAVVDHDCTVQQGCHICLNSVVKNQGTVPACTKLEAGEVFAPAR